VVIGGLHFTGCQPSQGEAALPKQERGIAPPCVFLSPLAYGCPMSAGGSREL